jgi:hypothetical protein
MSVCHNCGRTTADGKVCAACMRAYQRGRQDGYESANGKDELRHEPLYAAQAIGYDGTLGPMWEISSDRPAHTEVGALVEQIDQEQRWREEGFDR